MVFCFLQMLLCYIAISKARGGTKTIPLFLSSSIQPAIVALKIAKGHGYFVKAITGYTVTIVTPTVHFPALCLHFFLSRQLHTLK